MVYLDEAPEEERFWWGIHVRKHDRREYAKRTEEQYLEMGNA
jgi:hypothetical protein